MPAFTDQIGRTVFIPRTPCRIISLVPSQTELLYCLGLDQEVVGITRFCVRPAYWFHTKPRIGGTKAIDPARVDALHPDLLIANKEENDKPQIEALATRYPVWVSNVRTLPDALAMIRSVGELTSRAVPAGLMADEIGIRFSVLGLEAPRPRAAYLMWYQPYMAAGGDTFIHEMLEAAGFENVFAGASRYPVVELEDLGGPAGGAGLTLLLSSEPFPFREKHVQKIRKTLPQARILLVDGQFFSWYGSRLLDAPAYFRTLTSGL